jgi:NADP-dependent 3-hydroxy acid dehydrogenase YdfG
VTTGDLSGVFLVTGAARGIGAAVAGRMVSSGAVVVAVDRDQPALQDFADALNQAGGQAHPRPCDVRDFAALAELCGSVEAEIGPLRGAVAAAGIAEASSLASGDVATWQAVVDTNVLGTAHLIRAVLPFMVERREGDVVVVGSTSGLETYVGEPLYCASKWAVSALVDVLRKETAPLGVRVTLVAPGLVDTALSRATPLGQAELARLEPLQPDDVARAVIFALLQPPHVVVSQITLRPRGEE